MKKLLTPALLLCLFAQVMFAQTTAKTYEFRNGSWYNGRNFTNATWYVSGGLLTQKVPIVKIDSVIDLQGKWVVPPMGDAFCSSVAGNASSANMLKMYIEEGTFYLQALYNTQEGRAAAQAELSKPMMPEMVFANAPITCSLGYPFLQVEGPAQNVKNPQQWGANYDKIKVGRKMQGNGYWFVDNKDALAANWDKIKAQKPDIISIVLFDVQNSGGKADKGLTEDMAKAVIKKAHKADLRVYAHIETADDVRLGLKLGVDGFANLPGNAWNGIDDLKKYELTEADIKLLVKKRTVLVTLLAHAQTASSNKAVIDFHNNILKRLLQANANVVIGSDDPQRTARGELSYWFNLYGLDYARALKAICENTPRAIFPNRKIGKIEEGFEGSFIVLLDNPLDNILKIRAISFKVKNGELIK